MMHMEKRWSAASKAFSFDDQRLAFLNRAGILEIK